MSRKITATSLLVGGLVLALAMGARAADEEAAAKCAGIAIADERLACFDAAYGGAPKAPGTGGGAAVTASSVATTNTPATSVAQPSEDDFGRQKSKVVLEGESMSSTVVGIDKDAYGKQIFELENGQTWRQIERDRFRAKVGNAVEVRHGSMGSYKLYIEGDSFWTRVRRVE